MASKRTTASTSIGAPSVPRTSMSMLVPSNDAPAFGPVGGSGLGAGHCANTPFGRDAVQKRTATEMRCFLFGKTITNSASLLSRLILSLSSNRLWPCATLRAIFYSKQL